jgi:hypothetical protein
VPGSGVVRSDFDSDVFGVEFYRVISNDVELIRSATDALPKEGVIVDAKVPADDMGLVAGLDAIGFRKVSTLVEFETKPAAGSAADPDLSRSLELGSEDLEAHATGFRFQRLMQDVRIDRARTSELMRRWIVNSLAGRRETLAIGRNFCTFSVHDGRLTIDLLSCLDKGQGIGARLLRCVHAEAAARGCTEVRVTTEAENITAMRLYSAAGFRPVAAWAAMHLVRP